MTSGAAPLQGTRYRTLRQLGQGGMGVVLEAERLGLGRRYAVKLLLAEGLTEPSAIERFRREPQVLAKLSSPHLVAVHDLDVAPDGRPYLVMDLLRGRNLREVLRERAGDGLPLADALRFAREALSGLSVAHAEGVVHRDVKLDNLFLTEPDGGGPPIVKVLDFGIAKAVASLQDGGGGEELQTGTGVIVGTPKYASPEQIKGDPVDERADLYSLALVLYELLTGQHPFDREAEREQGVMRLNALYRANLLSTPAAPSTLLATPLPDGLDAVVLRGLEKNPADRWPSARAFAEALAAIEGTTFRVPKSASKESAARRESVFDAGDLFLGKYRIEKLLGRGGMGEVYLAHHEVLSERYALKVLPLVRAKVAQRRNMLLREAKAATKVKHESTVRVVDAGEGEILAPECGVYVDASASPGGTGSRGSPAATLDEAIAVADRTGASRIYVCEGAYAGGQLIPGGTSLLGGFDCDWTRAAASRATIAAVVGGEGGPPATLTLAGGGLTRLEDLRIEATLTPATPGASTIGVLAIDADLAVSRLDIEVAAAANGATGDTPIGGDLDGITSGTGVGGVCGAPPTVAGGNGGFKTCGDGTTSVGGDGGKGTVNGGPPSDGDDGVSDPQVTSPLANAGDGEPLAGNCTNGDGGAPGAAGTPATAASGLGTLSSSGYEGVSGGPGQSAGSPGQGGGGGGGGRGADHCSPTSSAGPSGGGGGSGGCAGTAGAGGTAGGSSIGIAAIRSALSVEDSTISTGNGGIGGAGSPGQQGGAGGGGANGGGSGACNGGQGGRGGWGGAGGGGHGGHSIAIAYFDAPSEPFVDDDVNLDVGDGGGLGAGGDGPDDAVNGNAPSNVGPNGAAGVRCAVLHFGVDPGDACVVAAG